MSARRREYEQSELDRLVWADSFTIDLNGLACQLQGTSAEFVRSAARLVHLPRAMRKPDVVFSAVQKTVDSGRAPVLSLYVGRKPALRTLSSELLLDAFLSELRGRALVAAADRVFLKMSAVRILGAGVLLPTSALRRLVDFEKAAARARIELVVAPALTIDLKTGRPVPGFTFTNELNNYPSITSIDAIAVRRTAEGHLPSRADVLQEVSENSPNLRSVGGKGVEALELLVERAELIEWNEARPHSMIERLSEKPLVLAG
jgi:hypothetical protein